MSDDAVPAQHDAPAPSRRTVLRTTAGVAGAGLGIGAIGGAPAHAAAAATAGGAGTAGRAAPPPR
ncbi:hypothetical protein ACISUF_17995, partial [Streptomyces sp. NPDC003090]